MVTACPISSESPPSIRNQCENPLPQNYDENQLVADPLNQKIFYNKFCAQCHQVHDFVPIKIYRFCNQTMLSLLQRPDIANNSTKKLITYITHCEIMLNDKILIESLKESPKFNESMIIINRCDTQAVNLSNFSVNNEVKPPDDWICRSMSSKGFTMSFSCSKNAFCGFDSEEREKGGRCCFYIRRSISLPTILMPSFTILMDFNADEPVIMSTYERNIIDKTCKRQPEEYFSLRLCQISQCHNPLSFYSPNELCLLIHNFTEINMDIKKQDNLLSSMKIAFSICLEEFGFKCINEIRKCFGQFGFYQTDHMNTLLKCIHSEESDSIHLSIWLLNKNLNKTKWLSTIMENLERANLTNQLISISSKLYHVDVEFLNTTITSYFCKETKLRIDNDIASLPEETDCEITHLINCTASVYMATQENVNLFNHWKQIETAHHPNQSNNQSTSWSILSNTQLALLQCNKKNNPVGKRNSEYEWISHYINLCITPISCIFLIFLLITYSIFPSLRTLPGLTIMTSSVSLLIHYLLFYILGQLKFNQSINFIGCLLGSIFNHYALLTVFANNVILAVNTARTFLSKSVTRNDSRSIRKIFVRQCLIGYFIPLLITVSALITHFVGHVNIYVRENMEMRHCFLLPQGVLYFVFIPAGITILTSFILWILIVVTLCRSVKQSSMATQRSSSEQSFTVLLIGLKLVFLFGVIWLLLAVNIWIQSLVLTVICDILLAGQGLFLGVTFGLNERCRKLYKDKILKRKYVKESVTRETVKTDMDESSKL